MAIAFGEVASDWPWSPNDPARGMYARQGATQLNRRFKILHWYYRWAPQSAALPNSQWLADADANGSIPMITWEPWDGTMAGGKRFSDIRNTTLGSLGFTPDQAFGYFIDYWAGAFKTFNKPVLLRFAHEMNGNWYPWSVGRTDVPNGPTAADYIATFRYVVSRFRDYGCDKVKYVWTPNFDIGPAWPLDIATVYPGDAYVDYVGADVYCTQGPGWHYLGSIPGRNSDGLLEPIYAKIRTFTQKPWILPEIACEYDGIGGGAKQDWIRQTYLYDLPQRFPAVVGFIWFDQYLAPRDFRMDAEATYAFAAMKELAASPLMQGTLL
jgi:hypothetical protein